MPKTPMDVMTKKFSTARFRSGYARREVDDFLAEANREIQRLIREKNALHERLESASTAPAPDTKRIDAEFLNEPTAILAKAERQYADFLDFAHMERTRLIREASETAQGMVDDAERVREETINGLKEQKMQLDQANKKLHQFASEHQISMKNLMQEELRVLGDGQG